MSARHYLLLAAAAFACTAAPAFAAGPKPVISSASDFPVILIELPAKPSVLVGQGGPALDKIKDEVESYVDMVLRDYDIPDISTRKQLLTLQLQAAIIENRWDDVIAISEGIQAIEDKPSAKATAGLITRSYARAAKAVGEDSPQFPDRFQQELETATAKLDWSVTQDELQELRAQYQLISRDLLLGSLQGLDANAAAQNNKVGLGLAAALVGARRTLVDLVPLKDRIFAVFDRRVKSESAEKVDRWSERLVTLSPSEVAAPVTIGMWDSGTDPKVLAGQMWTNVREKPNGKDDDGNGFVDDIHGIAFDTDYRPSTGMLRPMESADVTEIARNLKLTKGSLDMQASVDTPEAAEFRQAVAALKPDQVMPFILQQGKLALYLHGTTTAYTAAIGNPGARVLAARFDQRVDQIPDPIDEKVAAAMAAYARQTVAYFKAHGVRVVNMSWRVTEPQIDATLQSVEPDPGKRKERTQAIFATINGALEQAFADAPDILFIAGAGNEDEDVDFVRSFPAGINLPNVMTVGAVDVALQPANFTSYGKSIDVYANGFEVPAKVPGGMPINISGTSLAAPQVTNLAAKLFAVNPRLTAAQVRAIIEQTASPEGSKKLKVIDPKRAIAAAKSGRVPNVAAAVAIPPPIR
jgi:hypothetical protein